MLLKFNLKIAIICIILIFNVVLAIPVGPAKEKSGSGQQQNDLETANSFGYGFYGGYPFYRGFGYGFGYPYYGYGYGYGFGYPYYGGYYGGYGYYF